MQQLLEPQIHILNHRTDRTLEVQIFSFGGRAKLVQGNLHIRTTRHLTPTKTQRKNIVSQALQKLDKAAEPHQRAHRRLPDDDNDDDFQPVVCVLLGDTNLSRSEAEEAVHFHQPGTTEWNNVWSVHAANAQWRGDIIYVKGAHAKLFELPAGVSHAYRGVRNDQHDAFGVELKLLTQRVPAAAAPSKL